MANTSVSPLSMERAPWPLNDRFKSDWERLLQTARYTSPFDYLEWIESGIACFAKGEIMPCRFFDTDGTLRAMGMLRISEEPGKLLPRTVVRSIDYNSQRILPLLASDIPTLAEAMRTLVASVDFPVDSFDFFKLDELGGSIKEVSTLLKRKGVPHSLEVFNEQPFFPLTGTWKEYLSERTQGHRKRIRRYTRKLWERYPDYTFQRYQSEEDFADRDFESVLHEIFGLYDKSWQADALSKDDALHDLKGFYRNIATVFLPKGMLDLCTLHADHTLLAFELNLCTKSAVYMLFGSYNRDYSDWSPGNAILSEILQDSYTKGYDRVEFGGEFLDYKKLWTKSTVKSFHLRLHGNTLKAKIKRVISR